MAKKSNKSGIDMIAYILVIVAALDFGLALFGVTAIGSLSGGVLTFVQAIIGLAGLYALYKLFK